MKKGIFLLFLIFILFVSIGYAAVFDADEDGVPDDDDKCPNSDTDIVDQFGCSCAQKNCPSDNNPCTDDCSIIDGLPSCTFTNNNATCPGGYCYEGKCDIILEEQVKCLFEDSTDLQECYNSKGDKCNGIETCVADVKGKKGEKVTWKSSCGQYAYTVIDGLSEYAIFQCDNQSLAEVEEQVKCVFLNSTTLQKCYSEKGSCNSTETCVVNIRGKKGEEIVWKSSCGGYAYTIIDGVNEHAYFDCRSTLANGTQQNCTDTDGGKNYYTKGTTEGKEACGPKFVLVADSCTENIVHEGFCGSFECLDGTVGYGAAFTGDTCPNGCKDGACIGERHVCGNNTCEEAITNQLLEKETKIYTISDKAYEVTLNFVGPDEVQFIVNGQVTKKLKIEDTDKLADGTIIRVTGISYQDLTGGVSMAKFSINTCPQDCPLNIPPKPPFNLKVSTVIADGSKIAKLEWQNVDGEKFYIYKNKNEGEFTLLDSTSEKVYKDEVNKDVKYGYYVTAVNENGESRPSNTVYVYPSTENVTDNIIKKKPGFFARIRNFFRRLF